MNHLLVIWGRTNSREIHFERLGERSTIRLKDRVMSHGDL